MANSLAAGDGRESNWPPACSFSLNQLDQRLSPQYRTIGAVTAFTVTPLPTGTPAPAATATSVPTPAPPVATQAPPDLVTGIAAHLTSLVEKNALTGSVLVAGDGEVLLSRLAIKEPNRPQPTMTTYW
jgi:hypothetical protein